MVTNTGCTVPRHLHSVRQTWHGPVMSGHWRCTLPYSKKQATKFHYIPQHNSLYLLSPLWSYHKFFFIKQTMTQSLFTKKFKAAFLNFAWERSKEKCTLNFIKYTLGQIVLYCTTKSALLPTKSALLHSLWCNKTLFVGNRAQLPMCLSAGY